MNRFFYRIIVTLYSLTYLFICFYSKFTLISELLGFFVLFVLFNSFRLEKNPLLFMYNIYVLIFFLPRFFIFYFFPYAFGKIGSDGVYILDQRAGLVDDVLFYFSVYYLLTFIFIFFVNRLLPLRFIYRKYHINGRNESGLKPFLLFFLFLNIIGVLFIQIVDIGMLGQTSRFNFLFRILSIPALTIYFVFISLNYSELRSNRSRILVILNLIVIFVNNVLLGSRSFLLTLVLSALVINYIKRVFKWSNFNFSIGRILAFAIVGIGAWYFGTVSRQGEFMEFSLSTTILSIFTRMGGGADSFIAVLNTSDFEVILNHHSWLDSLLKSLNSLAPGDIFSIKSNITAGQLFKQDVYSNFSGEFHGDYWSGFGYFYAVDGFINSIFTIFLIVLGFQLLLYIQDLCQGLVAFIFSVELVGIFCESFLLQGSADSIAINVTISFFTFSVFFFVSHIFKRSSLS